jgi:hypothetical protein
MEGAGMRSFASVDELSEETSRAVRLASVQEARALCKELLVALVQQHIETDKQRLAVKERDAELKNKDAILKALLSKGASLSDSMTIQAASESQLFVSISVT